MTTANRRLLAADAEGRWVRHWQSPEWIAQVDAWVTETLTEQGIRRTGPGVTFKIRFWSVLRRYPTARGIVWFKENNPGQAFEAGLVATLARLLPDLVQRPLGVDAQRGWLLTPDEGGTLADTGAMRDRQVRLRLVGELVRLQRSCVEHEAEVHAAGLTTVGPAQAAVIVRRRLAQLLQLRADHPRRPTEALATGLAAAADRLEELAPRFDTRLPLTLDHNDLHASNVFGDVSGPLRIFDFGDAVWGHPFGSMHSLVNSLDWSAGLEPDQPAVVELIAAYLDGWTDLADRATLHAEWRRVRVLQPVTRIASWSRLLDHADEIETRAWIDSPRHWLSELVRVTAEPPS